MPWWQPLVSLGYPGIFLLSFLGASSVIFPIPYAAALVAAGATRYFNLFFLAIAAGLGAALGEFVGYGAGYVGREFASGEYERKFEAMLRIFEKYGAPAVFLFALTPLPDDLLFIPLGLARYSFLKAFVPCALGKFLMSLILVYIGSAASESILGGWFSGLVMMVLLGVGIYVILRLDWESIASRLAPESETY